MPKKKRQSPHRSKSNITLRGRANHPMVHTALTGAKFIMVRSPRGRALVRLYEGSKYFSDKAGHIKKRLRLG